MTGVGDLDELLAPSRWDLHRCSIEQALAEIDDEEARAKVAAATRHPRVPTGNVVEAFRRLLADEPPADQAVRRHRAGKCKCRV